jgi:TonB family protein
MHCATVLGLTLIMAVAKTPQAFALPFGGPLPERESQRSASSDVVNRDQQVPAPRPNPDAAGKYHVGDGVSAPKLVYAPDPEFTSQASKKSVSGTVVLTLTVDATGKPHDVSVSRSLTQGVRKKLRPIALRLDGNAVRVVKEYRFEPAEFQGKPVPVDTTLEISYRAEERVTSKRLSAMED